MTFGRYRFTPFTWVMGIPPRPEKRNKKGEVVKESKSGGRRSLCYIYVETITPNGDGMVWVFTGQGAKNKPLTFSDSRDKQAGMGKGKRLSPAQVEAEIARLTRSEADAAEVMLTMHSRVYQDERGAPGVAKAAVAALLGCDLEPYTTDDGFECTRLVGGLVDRVKGGIAASRDADRLNLTMSRR